jgi:ATP-dependent DNA ligase
VALPLRSPVAPQLARTQRALPQGDGWAYEPKWDGFRTIAFVEDDERELQSRAGRDLTRYFPEVVPGGGRYVVDGELVIVGENGRPDFELLQQRIHPAQSRIERLAGETPARLIAFDLLARDGETLLERPFAERRAALEELCERASGFELTPHTRDHDAAGVWLREAEGVIAKELGAPYLPGQRRGMVKIKRLRTVDCVVVGWRPGKEEGTVGSLILGLYDGDGRLHVVGHTSGFKAAEKRSLVEKLHPYETGERGSGDVSRWTQGRELEWISLRPELVVEITFDHVSGGRIRHGTTILRWRDDRDPKSCSIEQLEQ